MQKAVVFAILAPMLYALANVFLEHKFAKYNTLSLMVIYCSAIFAMAFAVRWFMHDGSETYRFPAGEDFWLLIVLAFIFFLADFFFIGAYTNGGDLATITILTLLFPVFASLFKFLGSRFIDGMAYAPPNAWLLGAYALAALAVLCVLKGAPAPKL